MTIFHHLTTTPWMPWRLRNSVRHWVEFNASAKYPALYRWLHFGSSRERACAVTRGPSHHFFGYYEKSPWNSSQTLLLAHEVDFNDRAPGPDDRVRLGVIDLSDNRFEQLGDSLAWNWQQGAMLCWHPANPERHLVHNDTRNNRHVGVVCDISGKEVAAYDRPIYSVLPDGKTAFSVNFSRLARHRPGYGYAGSRDIFDGLPHPPQDGIWRIDLESGESRLIISLDQLATLQPKPSMAGGFHYINHIQPSRGSQWIAFFHIWTTGPTSWEVRLYICRPDGAELRCLIDTGRVSHYDWLGDDAILVWAAHPATGKQHFLLWKLDGSAEIFGHESLPQDGHCTFSPDRRWVLNDTYPDQFDMRTLMLVKWPDGNRIDIARLFSPKSKWWGEIRCDLHPRWSPDGNKVCIDSVHEGTRQMYIVDVSEWTS